jgi:hypothetical protein
MEERRLYLVIIAYYSVQGGGTWSEQSLSMLKAAPIQYFMVTLYRS